MSSFANNWNIEDEVEVFRLKRLLSDNILRIEKENLDLVRGILSESNSIKKKFKNDASSKTALQTAVWNHVKTEKEKSTLLKKIKSDGIGKNSSSKRQSMMSNTQPVKSMVQKSHVKGKDMHSTHSHIEFLNDFHSSLLSAKLKNRVLPSDVKCKYAPCAIPLAPPEQKMSLNRTNNSFQNVSYHHVKFKDTDGEHLSVQALPSITIEGKKECQNHVNFSVEVINAEGTVKNKLSANSSHIKTTFFPIQAQKKVFQVSRQTSSSLIEGESNLKDSGTQADLNSSAIPESFLYEQKIKQLIEEAVKRLGKCCSSGNAKESGSYLPKSDKGNCEASSIHCDETVPSDVSSLNKNIAVQEKSLLKSSSCQTTSNNATENSFVVNQNELRNIIEDAFMDNINYLQNYITPSITNSSAVEKGCKSCSASVQTSESMVNINNLNSSKGVQVSLVTDQQDEFHSSVEGANKYISHEGDLPLETSTNSEIILKSIYEHICKEKMNASSSELILERPSVLTRDVAVQFNPLQTCNKCTSTNEIRTVDAFSQCETSKSITRSTKDTSVQLPRDLLQSALSLKLTDSCTQIELLEIVSVDASTQTADFLNVIPPSELSGANTSISSTPLSENMFIDDKLSEGEIALPWNLRLLCMQDTPDNTLFSDEQESRTDKEKAALSAGEVQSKSLPGRTDFNCSLTDETSDISGKEKDYSLSEGEIPPNYIAFLAREESDLSNNFQDEHKHSTFLSQDGRIPDHHLSYSSMSEIELSSTNTSLSQGEELPSNERNYCSKKSPNLHVLTSLVDDKLSTVLNYAKNYMQTDAHKVNLESPNSKILKHSETFENEHCRKDPSSVPSTSRAILQTVEEEVSSQTSF